jgi:diaminopimelate decarboxylase
MAGHRYGTPAFVTDVAVLDAMAAELAGAFPDPWIRQYSVKANDVTAIVRRLGALGLGANVVSAGEWAVARRADIADERITLEGAGKSDRDLATAVRAAADGHPPRWVAVESPDELTVLTAAADGAGLGSTRPALDVLMRLNPDVTPDTHHAGLAVGAGASKFGMTETELTEAVERAALTRSLRPRGIHLHIGSQLHAVDAWRDAVRRALAIVGLLRGGLDSFDTLDVGGGFAVPGPDGGVPAPERFARELPALIDGVPEDRRPTRWAVEPGRFLVARASWIVASVLHVRERAGDRLVVLDAGMTELIRPALYGAHHPIVALTSFGRAVDGHPGQDVAPTRVDGPICESTDALGDHDLPPLRRGDFVAIGDAGAYGASMASTYNGRPSPPQVLLEPDGRLTLGRRRGVLASLG